MCSAELLFVEGVSKTEENESACASVSPYGGLKYTGKYNSWQFSTAFHQWYQIYLDLFWRHTHILLYLRH